MRASIEIRRLTEADAPALWRLRLTALESEPYAFAESPAEHFRTTVEGFGARLREASGESLVLGAFDGPALVGMVGLYREQRIKRRHKAGIWGMFVLPEYRGQGTARSLVSHALEEARAMPGVRQVFLSVVVTQSAARRLYVALGFHSYGVEPQSLEVNGELFNEEHMYFRLPGEAPTSKGPPDLRE